MKTKSSTSVSPTLSTWQTSFGVGDFIEILNVREDGGFTTVATLHPDVSQPGNVGGFASKEERVATCIANAHLITAAPELLAVLEAILSSECAILNELRDRACAAIAKAKA